MLPKNHFLLGLIACLFLYFGLGASVLSCVVFLIATVGIDIDHYLYYVYRKKDWSLRRAFGWFVEKGEVLRNVDKKNRKDFFTGFCFLHGIEVLFLLGFLGYFVWGIFYFICLGFLFHLILDHIHQAFWGGRFDKFSIVYDYFKYGKLKFVDELEVLAKLKK